MLFRKTSAIAVSAFVCYAMISFPFLLQRSLDTRHLIVFLENVGQRPNRRNRKWIDLPMTLGVVIPDVLELRRLAERLGIIPIQMPHPLMQVGVAAADVANVALEVLHVDWVEADDCRKQADICFCDVR